MSNRLSEETSPYLLQHADNPVDWRPWGEEAFNAARERDLPVFLSIGYSACHWCHVMERESFSDDGIAALLNESFVPVKVDREERPDVDSVYMRAVQAMTGQGGWPLSVFLTPDAQAFYGGTYFPPEPKHGMPSFRQVLLGAAQAYQTRRKEVRRAAGEILRVLKKASGPPAGVDTTADEGLLAHARRTIAARFDLTNGGFGAAPKFPQPVTLEFLLRHHHRTGEADAVAMTLHTLRRMGAGGIRDHLEGGFHRYSVDARWLVPHFEKMLYDNALLARLYVQAWQASGEVELRDVAVETLDWLLGDMRSPEGGLYAARDADSEGEEGRYYVWTPTELIEAAGAEEARLFGRVYDVSHKGNFEGRSILHLPHSLDAVARAEGLEPDELLARLRNVRSQLLTIRAARPEPFRDEKILTSWNAMAIRALAEAGGALDKTEYVEAAIGIADFVLAALRPRDRLLHTFKDGKATITGFLDDHGALGNALLTLHEVTLDPRWLHEAKWACDEILDRFWDEDEATLYDAPVDGEALVIRPRDPTDTATPSGTSLAVELLIRLAHVYDKALYRDVGALALERLAGSMRAYPGAFGRLLSALDRSVARPVEVAVVGSRDDPATRSLLSEALRPYLPNRTILGRDPGETLPGVPLLERRSVIDGRPTAYVCEGYSCRLPVTTPEALANELRATLDR